MARHLNVEVGAKSMDAFLQLRVLAGLEEGVPADSIEAHRIEGFERDGKSFGEQQRSRGRYAVWEGNGRNVRS